MVPRRYIEFRTNLPETPTQKVEKYRLKQEGITVSRKGRHVRARLEPIV
jgi:hypothetical protein